MGHLLGTAPCAEAPHPVGFIRSVGFYPSLASTFPAHYCPLHGLVSFLRAITLIIIIITIITITIIIIIIVIIIIIIILSLHFSIHLISLLLLLLLTEKLQHDIK